MGGITLHRRYRKCYLLGGIESNGNLRWPQGKFFFPRTVALSFKLTMSRKPKEMALSPGQVLNHQRVRRISRLDTVGTKYRIATWNVRSLFIAGKLANAVKEMNRMKIDILGISESRWNNSGACQHKGSTFYYSGRSDGQHKNGVGILVRNTTKKFVKNVVAYSDRIIMIQLEGRPVNVNIIQIYAPTADTAKEDIDNFYEQLREILRSVKTHEINMIIGDFNAKVGREITEGVTGGFGLGARNETGELLVQFCKEEDLVIKNTYYDLPPRRLYTWRSPQDKDTHIVRNQIDYLIINKRFQNNIKRVAAYPGADIGSDHNPVIADFRFRGKLITQKTKGARLNIQALKENGYKEQVRDRMERECQQEEDIQRMSVEDHWASIKRNIQGSAEEVIGYEKRETKKSWMTEDILNLMEERRRAKNNEREYKEIHQRIRREIKAAKNKWLVEQCKEAENMHAVHDSFHFHKKLKEITNTFRKTSVTSLKKNSKILTDTQDIQETWREYIQDLFDDNRTLQPTDNNNELSGPPIMISEIRYALSTLKDRKAPGQDNIHAELLKLFNAEQLCALFNKIYDTGDIPSDWLVSTFVAIPKKANATTCEEHRLISLMSHALKAFLRVIHGRIYRRCEENSGEAQFGFKNGLGTREALFCMQLLVQKCYDQRKDVFMCFVDYRRAFDSVRHDLLMPLLEEIGLDGKDIRVIHRLYWDQTAELRIGGTLTTDRIRVCKGVRQGCILSPLLFNIYVEKIFRRALENEIKGIKINGIPINNLRYADDTAILADNIQDLQDMVNAINLVGREYGLSININKTNLMVISRGEHTQAQIEIDNQIIQTVNSFKYLGTTLNSDWDCDAEVRKRVAMARNTFTKFSKFLLRREVALPLKLRVVKCYIWPILLYGMEAWSLKVRSLNRIEAFEMWTLRRILRISWIQHVTNNNVLERAHTRREILDTVKKRKVAYLGHILRGPRYELLKLILMGKIEGRRGPGRKQHSWLRNIRDWCDERKVESIFRKAEAGILSLAS